MSFVARRRALLLGGIALPWCVVVTWFVLAEYSGDAFETGLAVLYLVAATLSVALAVGAGLLRANLFGLVIALWVIVACVYAYFGLLYALDPGCTPGHECWPGIELIFIAPLAAFVTIMLGVPSAIAYVMDRLARRGKQR